MNFKQKATDLFLDIYTFPINLIIGKMTRSHRIAFQTKLFKHIKDSDNYVSLSFFPVHIKDINIGQQTDRNYRDTTIILQGPIAEKNNFTVETVELYKKYYNDIQIIVSTWENAPRDIIRYLKSIGVIVLTNKYPTVNGIGNMNYQLLSSLNGVKKAKDNDSIYVWKTRTDQRYYNPCALPCLIKMLDDKRLVMLGGINNSYVKRIFHISDFMAFGSPDELIQLYGCKLDNEDTSQTKYTHKNQANDGTNFSNYMVDIKKTENGFHSTKKNYDNLAIKYGNPETLITYYYYKAVCGDNDEGNLSDKYEHFLKNEIKIIDADNLGFFWLKYEYDSIKQTYFDRMGKLDFARWCSLIEKS